MNPSAKVRGKLFEPAPLPNPRKSNVAGGGHPSSASATPSRAFERPDHAVIIPVALILAGRTGLQDYMPLSPGKRRAGFPKPQRLCEIVLLPVRASPQADRRAKCDRRLAFGYISRLSGHGRMIFISPPVLARQVAANAAHMGHGSRWTRRPSTRSCSMREASAWAIWRRIACPSGVVCFRRQPMTISGRYCVYLARPPSDQLAFPRASWILRRSHSPPRCHVIQIVDVLRKWSSLITPSTQETRRSGRTKQTSLRKQRDYILGSRDHVRGTLKPAALRCPPPPPSFFFASAETSAPIVL